MTSEDHSPLYRGGVLMLSSLVGMIYDFLRAVAKEPKRRTPAGNALFVIVEIPILSLIASIAAFFVGLFITAILFATTVAFLFHVVSTTFVWADQKYHAALKRLILGVEPMFEALVRWYHRTVYGVELGNEG